MASLTSGPPGLFYRDSDGFQGVSQASRVTTPPPPPGFHQLFPRSPTWVVGRNPYFHCRLRVIKPEDPGLGITRLGHARCRYRPIPAQTHRPSSQWVSSLDGGTEEMAYLGSRLQGVQVPISCSRQLACTSFLRNIDILEGPASFLGARGLVGRWFGEVAWCGSLYAQRGESLPVGFGGEYMYSILVGWVAKF